MTLEKVDLMEEDEEVKCAKCGDGTWVETNKILLCDGPCGRAYHQNCHRPKVKVIPEDDWFCHSCAKERKKLEKNLAAKLKTRVAQRRCPAVD